MKIWVKQKFKYILLSSVGIIVGGSVAGNYLNNVCDIEGRMRYNKLCGYLANLNLPKPILVSMLHAFALMTNVNKKEMVNSFWDFDNFQDFFTRKVKKRDFVKDDKVLLVPADSELLSVAKIESDSVFQVKGCDYSLCEFLTNSEKCQLTTNQINQLKANPMNDLYSLIFYLSPGKYHRFHSPADFKITDFEHFKGDFKTVNPSSILFDSVN
jgi:phosphatidylserine decarboxylase